MYKVQAIKGGFIFFFNLYQLIKITWIFLGISFTLKKTCKSLKFITSGPLELIDNTVFMINLCRTVKAENNLNHWFSVLVTFHTVKLA